MVNEFITFEAIIKVWKEKNGDVAANRKSIKSYELPASIDDSQHFE